MNIIISGNNPAWYESIAAAGFSGVDLPMAGHADRAAVLSDEFGATLMLRKCRLDALGLAVHQVHLTSWPSHIDPVGDGSYEAYEDYMLPMLTKEIELAAQVGCHTAVMHPFFVQDGERTVSREGNVRLIERLLPTLEWHGVTLALENIYGLHGSDAHHECAEDMLYYTEHFDRPCVGICLDTGHALIRGQHPIALARAFGHHLKALHVHTGLSRCDNHALPCTVNGDAMDWPAFCRTLTEIGYDGNFNLEVRPPRVMPTAAYAPFYRLAYVVASELVAGTGL